MISCVFIFCFAWSFETAVCFQLGLEMRYGVYYCCEREAGYWKR